MNKIKGTRLVPCEIEVTDEQLLEAFIEGSVPTNQLIDKLNSNVLRAGELPEDAYQEHGMIR